MSKRSRSRSDVEAKSAQRARRLRAAWLREIEFRWRGAYEYRRWYPPQPLDVFNWAPIYPKVDDFWRATA